MSDSIKLHYTEAGQGTPLILLHGFPLSSQIWQEQQRQLSDQCRVITPDLRGHGKSPAPDGVYSMASMADDVFALMDALGIDKAAIAGHSMGGYVALAGYHRHPKRFAALGLVASQAAADNEEARQNRYKLIDKVKAQGNEVVPEAMMPRLFGARSSGDPLVEQVRKIMLGTSATSITGSLQGMAAREDFTEMLPRIGVPFLVVAGVDDKIVAVEKAKNVAAAVKGSTFVSIEGAGHMPMLEQPEAVTNALRTLLSPR